MSNDLEGLEKYATARQLEVLAAVRKHGTYRKAAAALGLHKDSARRQVIALKRKAAKRGWSPQHDMTETTPEGFGVKGVSGYYKVDPVTGEKILTAQWVKTMQDREQRLELMLEQVREEFSDSTYRVPKIAAPNSKRMNSDLMTAYPMGDPHIGMYAWAEESGADFDLEIARGTLVAAMQRLIACGPESETALIVNVGDFFHSDTQDNRTLRSGHALDVDTRWAKVLHVGVAAMRSCIELALQKHKNVRVINEIGNHDDHTSQVLTLALHMAYENNPRVSFDLSPARFHYHRFGNVLIGVTHGDTCKPEALEGVMATDMASDWGETTFRYWYTGHIHTRRAYEMRGCQMESFRTLAAKDAWTAGHGYRSGRDMYAIVHHRDFGEVERHRVDVGML